MTLNKQNKVKMTKDLWEKQHWEPIIKAAKLSNSEIGKKIIDLYKNDELERIDGYIDTESAMISRGYEEWFDDELIDSNQRAQENQWWLGNFSIDDCVFDKESKTVIMLGYVMRSTDRPAICLWSSEGQYKMAFPSLELHEELKNYPFQSWNWSSMYKFLMDMKKTHPEIKPSWKDLPKLKNK